ncbi:hypothetical protein [Streptomyces alanosinicus]|uniref:Uncharacterized protein n=1 Tax=Streptomyces alanosinicus TaxID=68171 RepID=A0A918YU09_9ACTN|nr:hypothetical protein [Streptomyces alanosinicus]GHE16064.1 hypothetical protein GCM10010339_92740 [Streptomyces alanosinicus]
MGDRATSAPEGVGLGEGPRLPLNLYGATAWFTFADGRIRKDVVLHDWWLQISDGDRRPFDRARVALTADVREDRLRGAPGRGPLHRGRDRIRHLDRDQAEPALTAPPSATPAAGPELHGKALAAAGGGGRPSSGKNPEAGPTWHKVDGKWQVDRTTVTLRDTVTVRTATRAT